MTGLNLSLLQGDILVNSGDGGVGSGGAGGAGGSISSVKAVDNGGNFSITAGYGGAADGAVGSGGAGGSILNTTYTLSPHGLWDGRTPTMSPSSPGMAGTPLPPWAAREERLPTSIFRWRRPMNR